MFSQIDRIGFHCLTPSQRLLASPSPPSILSWDQGFCFPLYTQFGGSSLFEELPQTISLFVDVNNASKETYDMENIIFLPVTSV
jgi:hypothetical protein